MSDYSIRLEGDVRRLMRRTKKLSDVDKKGVNNALAEAIRTSTKRRFKTTKAPDGEKWEESQRAREENGVTLTDTARLKNSIKSIASTSGFAVGTNTIYARTHQYGEPGRTVTIRAKTTKGLIFLGKDGEWVRKRKVTVHVKIPARPFLGLDEEDMHEIKGTLEDAFEEE